MRARDGHGARARSTRRPSGARLRLVRPDVSGASSVEYGLMIALICAVLCIGLGVTIQKVFGDTLQCFMAGLQGSAATSCSSGGSGDDGGTMTGTSTDGGPVPMSSPSPTVSPKPSPTPSPTPSP